MCKSEYKLIRRMQWDGDVLKVQDTMHDVLREAKQAMTDAMTGEVLNHFECDFSDFREYMHDKIKWEQKQWAAMPHWIPVTESLPQKRQIVIVTDGIHAWDVGMFNGLCHTPGRTEPRKDFWNWKKNSVKTVKWWMPKDGALPEPPKRRCLEE